MEEEEEKDCGWGKAGYQSDKTDRGRLLAAS